MNGRALHAVAFGAAVLVAASSVLFDYPLVVGETAVRVLPLRYLAVMLGVFSIWVASGIDAYAQLAGTAAPTIPSTAPPPRWVYPVVAACVLLAFAPTFTLDITSGNPYLDFVRDRPWRYFWPPAMWAAPYFRNIHGGDVLYRPLGYVFTGLVAMLAPQVLVGAGVALHALNAVLIARIATLLWPGQQWLALLAGVLAGLWPTVISTAINPVLHLYPLVTCFYLATVIAFEAGVRRERWALVGLAAFFFVAGGVTLELGITAALACAAIVLATGALAEHRTFALRASAAMVAVMLAYAAAYSGYVSYTNAHGPKIFYTSMVFPPNVKRMLLATTYLPLWSFLFPFADLEPSRFEWLMILFGLPLACAVATRAWRDRGVRFGVMAACIAMLPVANVFDMTSWGTARYGYLAFLWFCLPYAWVITHSLRFCGRTRLAIPAAIAAMALGASVTAVSSEQLTRGIRPGVAGERVASALAESVDLHGRPDAVTLINVDPATIDVVGRRAQDLLPATAVTPSSLVSSLVLDIKEERSTGDSTATTSGRTVDARWRQTQTPIDAWRRSAGSSTERVLLWNAPHARFTDITPVLLQRYASTERASIGPAVIHRGPGLSPAADGTWIQRGRSGHVRFVLDGTKPTADDELRFAMSIVPVGFTAAPAMNRAFLEWPLDETEGGVLRTPLPVAADGVMTSYRIRLGTNMNWMLASRTNTVVVTLPTYPQRVRLQCVAPRCSVE